MKGNRPHLVPLPPIAAGLLRGMMRSRGNAGPYVFSTTWGQTAFAGWQSFVDRLRRFWAFSLLGVLLIFAFALIAGGIGGLAAEIISISMAPGNPAASDVAHQVAIYFGSIPAYILAVWITLALVAKRLQDIGTSGTHAFWIVAVGSLAAVLPENPEGVVMMVAKGVSVLVNVCAGAYLLFWRGERMPNRFGPPPYAGSTTVRLSPA
jgi:uncharacterized membrane protein YhaH (DUF805 family)